MKKNKTKVRIEAKGFNRASEATHGRVTRTVSNIRLSLTLRIALHYCVQLFRTFLLAALIVLLGFGLSETFRIRETAGRILQAEPDQETGEYSQEIIQNADVTARALLPGETVIGEKSIKFLMKLFFTNGFPLSIQLYEQGMNRAVIMTVRTSRMLVRSLAVVAALVLADLIRMLIFVRKRKRLDRRVLAPIRDMTEMAQTLSAANLSNRINIAGTKNELRDLAVVINEMLDRIEQSYNSQKQFVSDASHELRTPIAVIQGYADMLRRWGKDDPEVLNEGIEAISQETANMKSLVENLLFLARHDKKTLMMEFSRFDPCDLVREVQKEAAMVSPADRFEMKLSECGEIEGDRGMLKQLLRILVDNAVKYAPEGSAVTLGAEMRNGSCILSVADQGCGIPTEELPRIFERFYRADAARHSETGGHGLGLSIARIITVAHGGKIRVKSKVGAGTCFEIQLPSRQEMKKTEEERKPATRKGKRQQQRETRGKARAEKKRTA